MPHSPPRLSLFINLLILSYCPIIFLLPVSALPGTSGNTRRPNIIFYLADDLGFGEVNQQLPAYGFAYNGLSSSPPLIAPRPGPPEPSYQYRTIPTPNLARMAREGMRCLYSYSPSSECAPSRAGIMVARNVGTLSIRGDATNSNGLDLDLDEPGFVVDLRAGGYDTALVGKWGLGSTTGAPWLHGFDYFYGQLEMKEAWSMYPRYMETFSVSTNTPTQSALDLRFSIPMNNKAYISEDYCAIEQGQCAHSNDLFRAAALDYVARHNTSSSKPFLLFWTPTVPHAGLYSPLSLLSSPVRRLGNWTRTMTQCRRGHAAGIQLHIDQEIGMLLDLLASAPNLAHTLFVFSSDNGPHAACRDDPSYSPSWFVGSGGLRGIKEDMWEGGMRVPTIVHWPGKVAPGTVSLTAHTLADLGPTFAQAAGLTLTSTSAVGPLGAPGGAVSLLDAWTGSDLAVQVHDWLHFELCTDNHPSSCKMATLSFSQGTLTKLVILPGRPNQAYELVADPTESNDLGPTLGPTLLVLNNVVREPLCTVGTPTCVRTTYSPSQAPSASPIRTPPSSKSPSLRPSKRPTTHRPTRSTFAPSTALPTTRPTANPTARPTALPTRALPVTARPVTTLRPTMIPTSVPTSQPISAPTARPTRRPRQPTPFPSLPPHLRSASSLAPLPMPTSQPSLSPIPLLTTQQDTSSSAIASYPESLFPSLPCQTSLNCPGHELCFFALPWFAHYPSLTNLTTGLCGCDRVLARDGAGCRDLHASLFIDALALSVFTCMGLVAVVLAYKRHLTAPWWTARFSGRICVLLAGAGFTVWATLELAQLALGVSLPSTPLLLVVIGMCCGATCNLFGLLQLRSERAVTLQTLGPAAGLLGVLWAVDQALAPQLAGVAAGLVCAPLLLWLAYKHPPLASALFLAGAGSAGAFLLGLLSAIVLVATTGQGDPAFEPGEWNRPGFWLLRIFEGLIALHIIGLAVCAPDATTKECREWVLTEGEPSSPSKPPRPREDRVHPSEPVPFDEDFFICPASTSLRTAINARDDRVRPVATGSLKFVFDGE